MADNLKTECVAFPACTHPNCACKSSNISRNEWKDTVDRVAFELQRASVSLSQFKIDLKDIEVEIGVIHVGVEQMIEKYTKEAKDCHDTLSQLIYSNVVADLKNVIKVSQQSAGEIISKTL
jgi:hypothetical protein